MPAFTATAPGKIILFGEHAVVYGQPAVAVPVDRVRARVVVEPQLRGQPGTLRIIAKDIQLDAWLDELSTDQPLVVAIQLALTELRIERCPACTVRVSSTIPVASGLGSGAAVSVALLRAFSAFLGQPLPDERISALAYEVEKIHHGTPSGIDNTVVTYAMPVYFVKGQPIQRFLVPQPFTIVIGDTGISSLTSQSVGDVRLAWQAEPERFQAHFSAIGKIVEQARRCIETRALQQMGLLMRENHALLQKIGVSCEALDRLVSAAEEAGAWGAKLSGGGRGGNMIALVDEGQSESVAKGLRKAGAVSTITTRVR
jgi:mevalonate kinase